MWPFTRKPKPINPGPINEDWRVGDLAECLNGKGWWDEESDTPNWPGPELGDVCAVIGVELQTFQSSGAQWYLDLSTFPGEWYLASCFRKVPPLNSEATAEFTARIKRCKPAHSPAPVA